MIIGTVRAEEARVFDSEAGYHRFHSEDGEPYGSFKVFWHKPDGNHEDYSPMDKPGWFWWSCQPGCIPDSEPTGPFASSHAARADADEFWDYGL